MLKSPGFPNSYPANTNCSWTLRVSRGRTISINFNNFNIEGTDGSCGGDYIQVCVVPFIPFPTYNKSAVDNFENIHAKI